MLLTPNSDGRYTVERGQQVTVVTAARLPTGYTRFYLQRRPLGSPYPTSYERLIPPVGTTYTFTVTSDERGRTLFTFDLRAAKPPLRPGLKPQLGDRVVTTTFQVETKTQRYTTYDTTGAATTQGSYAFLTGSGDDETAVTTYEGLRDGSATGLRIHKSDAYGASQAGVYDAVAVGDVVEWREASDCFVRYPVTEVKDDPAGDPPRKLLAVKVMTYAFTGCSGGHRHHRQPHDHLVAREPAVARDDHAHPPRPLAVDPAELDGSARDRGADDGTTGTPDRIR